MVIEQMIQEAPFNVAAFLLSHFVIFTFFLNIASDSCMLVQKGGVYLSAKEISSAPCEVQETAGCFDERLEIEHFPLNTECISCIRCFPVFARKTQYLIRFGKERYQRRKLGYRSPKSCLYESCVFHVFICFFCE